MSFLYPQLLWLLLLPAALLLATLVPRARAAALAHPKITRAQLKQSVLVVRPSSLPARPLAAALALACLVAALARPQGRTISTPTVTEARDVLVAVDVSRSMLVDDVAPNRLARAQLLIRDLADELAGERLGLLPFAGTAFLQSPLSADYEIFRTFLDELGPDMIPAGGSNFTALLNTADEAFGPPDSTAPDAPPPADRYLVILSDGEAQDESWKPVAQKLAARGVRVLALGLGTASGAMVPDGKGGLVKDERGAAVLSRLDASTLRELSRLTEGAYRDASAWVDLPALLKETVARGRGSRDTTDTAPRREELFFWFLAPALALLLASLVREFPVFPRPRRVSVPPLPPRAATTALAFLLTAHLAFVITHSSFAAEEAAAAPDPLATLVGQLAAADTLSGSDLARLAELTAAQGEQARAQQKDLPEGALRDALAAVSQGQATDPRAADWPALRQRIDTLLAPPPKPPEQPDQPKNEDQKSEDQPKDPQDSKDQKSSDSQNGSGSPDKSDSPSSPDSKPGDPSESKSESKDSPGQQSASSDPTTKPPGSSSEALGNLADKSDDKTPPDSDSKPAPAESAEPPPPDPAETQQVGGVSASGQPEGASAADLAAQMDPALAVPQQRLERVRDSDAPARLYQLMQDAELPPDSPARAAGKKQDW